MFISYVMVGSIPESGRFNPRFQVITKNSFVIKRACLMCRIFSIYRSTKRATSAHGLNQSGEGNSQINKKILLLIMPYILFLNSVFLAKLFWQQIFLFCFYLPLIQIRFLICCFFHLFYFLLCWILIKAHCRNRQCVCYGTYFTSNIF